MSTLPITPGPWLARYSEAFVMSRDQHGETSIETQDGETVIAVVERFGDEETVANAALIAAAPDLLLIAQELVTWYLGEDSGISAVYSIADQANELLHKLANGGPE